MSWFYTFLKTLYKIRLVSLFKSLVCSMWCECSACAMCVCVFWVSLTLSLPQMVKWVPYQWGVDAVCGKNCTPPFRPACTPPTPPLLTTFHRRPPRPAHREPELGTHKEGLAEAYRAVGVGGWLTGEFCATVGRNPQKKSHAGKQPESNCGAVCCQSQA